MQLSQGSGQFAAATGLCRLAGKQEPAEMWTAGFFLNVSIPFEVRAHLCPNMLFTNVSSPPLRGRSTEAELSYGVKPPRPALPKGPVGLQHLEVIIPGCWSRIITATWGWVERQGRAKVLLPLGGMPTGRKVLSAPLVKDAGLTL